MVDNLNRPPRGLQQTEQGQTVYGLPVPRKEPLPLTQVARVCKLVQEVCNSMGYTQGSKNTGIVLQRVFQLNASQTTGLADQMLTNSGPNSETPQLRSQFWCAVSIYFTLAKPLVETSLIVANPLLELDKETFERISSCLGGIGSSLTLNEDAEDLMATINELMRDVPMTNAERLAKTATVINLSASFLKKVSPTNVIPLGLLGAAAGVIKAFSMHISLVVNPEDSFNLLKVAVVSQLDKQITNIEKNYKSGFRNPEGHGYLKDALAELRGAKTEVALFQAAINVINVINHIDEDFDLPEPVILSSDRIDALQKIITACEDAVSDKISEVESKLVAYRERVESYKLACFLCVEDKGLSIKDDELGALTNMIAQLDVDLQVMDVLLAEVSGRSNEFQIRHAVDDLHREVVKKVILTNGAGNAIDVAAWILKAEDLLFPDREKEIETQLITLISK